MSNISFVSQTLRYGNTGINSEKTGLDLLADAATAQIDLTKCEIQVFKGRVANTAQRANNLAKPYSRPRDLSSRNSNTSLFLENQNPITQNNFQIIRRETPDTLEAIDLALEEFLKKKSLDLKGFINKRVYIQARKHKFLIRHFCQEGRFLSFLTEINYRPNYLALTKNMERTKQNISDFCYIHDLLKKKYSITKNGIDFAMLDAKKTNALSQVRDCTDTLTNLIVIYNKMKDRSFPDPDFMPDLHNIIHQIETIYLTKSTILYLEYISFSKKWKERLEIA